MGQESPVREEQPGGSNDESQGNYHQIGDAGGADSDADMALVLFRALTIITAGAGVLCIIANLVSLCRSFYWQVDLYVSILRIYAIVLAGLVVLMETEWTWLLRKWPYLQYWFGRGMIQILVAVMTKALAGDLWEDVFESLLHDIAGYMMLCCGFVHSFAGIVFVRQLKRRRIRSREWRQTAIDELEKIEAKRRHWQALLDDQA